MGSFNQNSSRGGCKIGGSGLQRAMEPLRRLFRKAMQSIRIKSGRSMMLQQTNAALNAASIQASQMAHGRYGAILDRATDRTHLQFAASLRARSWDQYGRFHGMPNAGTSPGGRW